MLSDHILRQNPQICHHFGIPVPPPVKVRHPEIPVPDYMLKLIRRRAD